MSKAKKALVIIPSIALIVVGIIMLITGYLFGLVVIFIGGIYGLIRLKTNKRKRT